VEGSWAGVEVKYMVNVYNSALDFLNDNLGFVSLVGGIIVYLVYWNQKVDKKRDAAKLVLQEIRRAEKIIADYKEHGHFKFTKKIIATNSWAKNIHFFVENLHVDKLDKISDLYSMGEYLDSIIKMVSDIKFDQRVHSVITQQAKQQVDLQLNAFIQKLKDNFSPKQVTLPIVSGNPANSTEPLKNIKVDININLSYDSISTDILFHGIVGVYEPIYYTDVVGELKKIAKLK